MLVKVYRIFVRHAREKRSSFHCFFNHSCWYYNIQHGNCCFHNPKMPIYFHIVYFFITVVAYKFTNLIVAKTSLGLLILFICQC